MSKEHDKKDDLLGKSIDPIYFELAGRIRGVDPEYGQYLLQKMYSLEVAKIVRELPAPAEEIAKKLNLKAENVEKTTQELVKKGYLLKTAKGPKLFGFLTQLDDIMMANPYTDCERDEEFMELYRKVYYNFFESQVTAMQATAAQATAAQSDAASAVATGAAADAHGGQTMRIIPKWKAIKDVPGVMPCEDMREIFKAYEGRLNNTRCFCRTHLDMSRYRQHAEKCGMTEGTMPSEGHCNHLGYVAEYYTEVMGITPYLTVEQMLASNEPLEKSRSYHMTQNRREVSFVCNCCECCGLSTLIRHRLFPGQPEMMIKNISPSRFMAILDKEKCNGCNMCSSKCPFDAITIKNGKAQITAKRCFGCGNCVLNCPQGALKMKLIRPADHIPVVEGPSFVETVNFEVEP